MLLSLKNYYCSIFAQDRQEIDCKENGFLTSFHVEYKVEDESKLF